VVFIKAVVHYDGVAVAVVVAALTALIAALLEIDAGVTRARVTMTATRTFLAALDP
jgi:hypothetical protein